MKKNYIKILNKFVWFLCMEYNKNIREKGVMIAVIDNKNNARKDNLMYKILVRKKYFIK